jgi:CheY-like chemotaxis protein
MQIMSRFNIPVIYLTASINEEKVRRIHPSGKCIFVTKPFEEYQLREAIETALDF